MSRSRAPRSGATTSPDQEELGHNPPSTPGTEHPPVGTPAPQSNAGVDRGEVIALGLRGTAAWSARFIIVVAALALALWLLAQAWVGVFPIIMAIIVSTVLWPVASWLMKHKVPHALAALLTLVAFFGLIGGVLAAIAPSVASQSAEIAEQASVGVAQVQEWAAGAPLNLDSSSVNEAVDEARGWLSNRSSDIASGVFSTVATVGSAVVTSVLVLVLVFFFLKDGKSFLPLVRKVAGRTAGQHLTEVFTRVWNTVSGFIRTQALVGLIDAVLIGIGLLVLGVPLAFALMVLTFFGAFIPIVGAFVAGGLAVLVALVSNGLTTAIIVLVIVLLVQQIEGNVLLPVLQSKSMDLHPGIVLLAVAAGGTLFGIIGAFLAVPVAASLVVVLRYMSEQIDLRTGDREATEIPVATPEGEAAAREGAAESAVFRLRSARKEREQDREQAHAEMALSTGQVSEPRLRPAQREPGRSRAGYRPGVLRRAVRKATGRS